MEEVQSLMTAKEVAERLNLSLRTVKHYTSEKRLTSIKLDPGKTGAVRYRPEDVEAFINEGVRS